MAIKKTNFVIPERRDQNIDSWIELGAPAHLTETQKSAFKEERQKEVSKQKIKRLTIDLDVNTHKNFKLKALHQDTNMVDLVRQWIIQYLSN